MKTIEVTIELLEEMLGTANADAKIHEDYIASKAPDAKSREEEVAALGADAVVEKSKTIFPKEDGKPFVYFLSSPRILQSGRWILATLQRRKVCRPYE